jgi:thiamine biosynthesis lipoprotein
VFTSNPDNSTVQVEPRGDHLVAICFTAMASPCELLLPTSDHATALNLAALVAQEAWRIEKKYSRYRDDSVTAWIHRSRGTAIDVDPETASLIDFANHCFELSEGLFDVTSGVLRQAWVFDRSDRVPEPSVIERLVTFVGFDKLQWQSPSLLLPPGMELDFGGIGKEYAVDSAYGILVASWDGPFLINFGGDLRASRPPSHGALQGLSPLQPAAARRQDYCPRWHYLRVQTPDSS